MHPVLSFLYLKKQFLLILFSFMFFNSFKFLKCTSVFTSIFGSLGFFIPENCKSLQCKKNVVISTDQKWNFCNLPNSVISSYLYAIVPTTKSRWLPRRSLVVQGGTKDKKSVQCTHCENTEKATYKSSSKERRHARAHPLLQHPRRSKSLAKSCHPPRRFECQVLY